MWSGEVPSRVLSSRVALVPAPAMNTAMPVLPRTVQALASREAPLAISRPRPPQPSSSGLVSPISTSTMDTEVSLP